MDIKSKSKSWAGNIYHQFETICQDFDDFMNKDLLTKQDMPKFVENRVQGVGLKNFYSNLGQDILPISDKGVVRKPNHVLIEKKLLKDEDSVDTTSCLPCATSKDGGGNSFEEKSTWDSMVLVSESSFEISDEDYKNFVAGIDSSPSSSEGGTVPHATVPSIECTFGMMNKNPDLEVEKDLSVSDSSPVSSSHENSSVCVNDGTVHDSFSAKDETNSYVCPDVLTSETNGSLLTTHTWAYNNAFPTDISNFVACSSESGHGQESVLCESEYSIFSPGVGNASEYGVDTHDLNMETIDLSSDAKDDKAIVILNHTASSTSHKRRNLRYYKKLIQDAFTSHKRISKEYKHLPILYGDIDMESSHDFRSSPVPSSPHYFFHPKTEETSDIDWELL